VSALVALMLLQDQPEVPAAAVGAGIGVMVFGLAVAVVLIASVWTVFTKAGKPGWAAIVPIYNLVVLLEIVGKPIWWIVLMLIPLVNFVVGAIVSVELARRFGKGAGFGIGLLLLSPIFYPLLAWGDARYEG
jgi:Family of unknown function (DUF5684)